MIVWGDTRYTTYNNSGKSERGRLLERLLEALLSRVRRRLFRSRGGSGNDGRFALLGRGLSHDFVERRLEDLDGVGERLAGTELTLGVPALHAEEEHQ